MEVPGAHPKGGCRTAAPSKSKFKKKTEFVDTIVSEVLPDLSFSRNQPLKSADDKYKKILKNKKKLRYIR
jgi:hypothetical protein